MISWLDIKNILRDHIKLATELLLLLLGAYVFIMAEQQSRIKLFVLFLGFFSWFFFRKKTKHPIIWLILFSLLIIDLYQYYFRVANHHFLLTFVVFSVLIYHYNKKALVLQKNIQMLLVIVIMTSAFQKLLSNQFMIGEFYYYMMNRAFVFDVFHPFFPEILEISKSNSESIIALQNTNPNHKESIVLKDVYPNLDLISLVYARVTVAIEFIVALALLFRPRSILTHLLFLIMIFGILCTRLEMGFMGLLSICGIFICKNLIFRLLYATIAMGCITLMIARVGFH